MTSVSTPHPLVFRRALRGDSRLVAWLIRNAFRAQVAVLALRKRDCPAYVGFETAARVRDRMLHGEQIWIASARGKVIGTVGMRLHTASPAYGEIGRLAVLPRFRGSGLGLSLMQAAERAVEAAGGTEARLSIVASFDSLRRYYERQGYVATHAQRYHGLPFEVLHLQKCLQRDFEP